MSIDVREIGGDELSITSDKVNYIYNSNPGLNKQQIREELTTALAVALSQSIDDLMKWIREYVPRATGQLQDHIINQLLSSPGTRSKKPKRISLKVGVDPGTGPHYARYVNALPDGMLQHQGTRRWVNYYGHYGYITLNDRKAQGGYAGLLRLEAKRVLRENLKDAIRRTITFDKRLVTWAGIKVS